MLSYRCSIRVAGDRLFADLLAPNRPGIVKWATAVPAKCYVESANGILVGAGTDLDWFSLHLVVRGDVPEFDAYRRHVAAKGWVEAAVDAGWSPIPAGLGLHLYIDVEADDEPGLMYGFSNAVIPGDIHWLHAFTTNAGGTLGNPTFNFKAFINNRSLQDQASSMKEIEQWARLSSVRRVTIQPLNGGGDSTPIPVARPAPHPLPYRSGRVSLPQPKLLRKPARIGWGTVLS